MSFYTKQLQNYTNAMYTNANRARYEGDLAQVSLTKAFLSFGGYGGLASGITGAGIGYGLSDNRNDYALEGGLLGTGLGILGGVGVATAGKSVSNNLFRGMKKYGDDLTLTGYELHEKGRAMRKGFWKGLNEVYPLRFD